MTINSSSNNNDHDNNHDNNNNNSNDSDDNTRMTVMTRLPMTSATTMTIAKTNDNNDIPE